MMRTILPLLTCATLAAVLTTGMASAQQFQPGAYYHAGGGTVTAAVVSADFNKDGLPDLAALDQLGGKVIILTNQGAGVFKTSSTFSTPPSASTLIAVDLNGDGAPDLLTVQSISGGAGNVAVFLGKGDGTFTRGSNAKVGEMPTQAVAADFNGDGHQDVAVVNSLKGGVTVLFGDGLGGLGNPASYRGTNSPQSIATGDVDGDGHPDLLVAGQTGTLATLLNNGDGTFRSASTAIIDKNAIYMTTGDLNHDGKLDAVISSVNGDGVDVLLGDGNGTFGAKTLYSISSVSLNPKQLLLADFNLDGNLDVVVATIQGGGAALLYGNADGTLQTAIAVPMQSSGGLTVAAADFDVNGAPDLAAGTENGKVGVFLNTQ